ncbi:MAG: DegV family protein [Candidatus Heimdallarchaeota archaeon]|nr:DegV family protein [Candidatus Heimdallarchaeota archaeon]
MSFKIVTDSACDVSEAYAQEHGITIIPTYVTFGKESFRDDQIAYKNFLDRLQSGEFAKTSQPTPADFDSVYNALTKDGSKVLSIHITSKLSGVYSNAVMMAKEHKGVYVFDSLNLTIGAGYLVYLARYLRDSGMSIERVITKLEQARGLSQLEILINNVQYLKRGGRINLSQYAILSLLQLKPILNMSDGYLVKTGIGVSHMGGLRKIIRRVKSNIKEEKKYILAFGYSTDYYDIELMHSKLRGIDEENIIEFKVCRTLLAHAGPGAAGIGLFPHYSDFVD